MNRDARFIKMLKDDLDTEGHSLGDEIQSLSDVDLAALGAILDHWKYQVRHERLQRDGRG